METLTIKKVEDYAKAMGVSYEINYPHSYIERYPPKSEIITQFNSSTEHLATIGLELKPHVWYWFKIYPSETENINNERAFFYQRYNRANGVIIKAFNTGRKAEKQILKFLNNNN